MQQDEFVTTREACVIARLSMATINRAIAAGELKAHQRKPGGKRLIARGDLVRWMTGQDAEPESGGA